MKEFSTELGKEIFEFRARNKLSVVSFAKMCKISSQTVYLYETGKQQNPTPTVLWRIRQVLDNEVI